MSLTYNISFSSNTTSWSLNQSSKKVSYLSTENTDKDRFQTGSLELYNLSDTPAIGDVVNININDSNIFSGYVSKKKQEAKGTKYWTIELIGKTYDLWRSNINDTGTHTFYEDYTGNMVSSCVAAHTDINCNGVALNEGVYISGVFEYQNESVGDFVQEMSLFDGCRFYVDSSNTLHYYTIDDTQAITINETDILSYTPFEESDDEIYNDVIVVGQSVSYRISSQNSIDTYGRYLKKISDTRITTEADASSMARTFVNSYASSQLYGSVVINGNTSIELGRKFNLSVSHLDITETPKISSYQHIIDKNGFTTKVNFGKSKYDPSHDISILGSALNHANYGIFESLSDAADAVATADGALVSYYQDEEPESASEGDLWFDTDDGNTVYVYHSDSWQDATNTDIAKALASAQAAQLEVDGKITTWYMDTDPTLSEDVSEGDLWVETDNGDYITIYHNSAWEDVGDYYTWWSNNVDDDGNQPDNNADVTADNSQYHNWLYDAPKGAHHPTYLVNGQQTLCGTTSSGQWVWLDDTFNIHCDCLIISNFYFEVRDSIYIVLHVSSNSSSAYSNDLTYCEMASPDYFIVEPNVVFFVPSGGGWTWEYYDVNAQCELESEHIVTLETDTT